MNHDGLEARFLAATACFQTSIRPVLASLERPGKTALRQLAGAISVLCLTSLQAWAQGPTIEDAVELHLEGRFAEALEAYKAVAEAEEASNPNVAAAAFTNSCLIHMNAGENEAALAACEEGLRLRRQIDDRPRLARTLNNLGLTLQNLGRFEESSARYQESLAINFELGDFASSSQNLLNLSGLAIQAGDYARAFENLDQALELATEHAEAPWSAGQRRIAFLNEGVALERLGAYREALESYRKALAEEGFDDRATDALLAVNVGVVYRNLGDPVRAVEMFEEALATYREVGSASGESNALLNLGLANHLNLDRPDAAEANYREALAISTQIGDRPEEILDLLYLGAFLRDQQRLPEARELFERALEASTSSGNAEGKWSALAGLGELAVLRGALVSAGDLFDRAIKEIETVRAELSPSAHRSTFFREKRSIYALASQVRADLAESEAGTEHRQDRAGETFILAQKAKARELLEQIDHQPEPYDHVQITSQLSGSQLLEYFVADRDLLRWTLSDSTFEMSNRGPAAPTLERALRVHEALARDAAVDPADLAALSETLLGGVEIKASELLISPDGLLRYLPFEILAAGDEPLVERARVSYLPSASIFPSLAAARELPDRVATALARPTPIAGGSRPAELMAERFALADLPATESELAALDRWLGGPARLLAGPAATESALRESAAIGSRVVHLATHTVIDERAGRGAAILLTPEEPDDGVLYPREIAALDLNVELTVLAACRTAISEDDAGSSIAGLTGAFLSAGSRGVVATLWDVGDQATAVFMEQFYWHLGKGATAAEALRRTKQRLRQDPEWSSPHLWAAYVLVGSGVPVTDPTRWGLWTAVGLAALLLVVALARGARSL